MADEPIKNGVTTDEIATTRNDPDIFSGWLTRLENSDPVLRTESNGRGLKLYDEVDRDPHAGSVLQTRYLSVAGKEWEVDAASDSPSDQAIADFVRTAMGAFNTTQAISELMQAVLYGYFVGEVMWQSTRGSWTPARIIAKHPRRFIFDLDRNLRMLTPANLVDGEAVPDRKFIVFTYGSSDNPYGKGLGQSLWWPVWFKKCGIKFWLVFLEKFGMPTPVGKYPPGTKPADQQKLLDALEAFQTDQGIKIPETMKIELIEATRSGNASYEGMCEYMDRQISKRVLGQTLTTEVGGEGGSYAASQTHNDVREDITTADADLLCECLNASLVRWMVDLNFQTPAEYPTVWLRVEEEKDLAPLAQRDKTLVNDIGVPVAKRYFYETYNLPEPEAGDELVGHPAATDGGAFAEANASDGQPAIDAMIDGIMPAAARERDRISSAIMDAVEQAKSFDEISALLAEMLSGQDIPGDMPARVAEAMFAANMWGRSNER